VDARTIPPLLPRLAAIPDARQARGRRHPLPAILALACAAMLAGCDSLLAIAEWGRDSAGGAPLAGRLGFTRAKTPCVATLHRVFRRIDVTAFEQVVGAWAAEVAAIISQPAAPPGMAIDGKVLRGSAAVGVPAVRLVSALRQDVGLVLAQTRGPAGRAETAALADVLADLVLEGMVVTLDASFTEREIAQAFRQKGGTT
jgi:DDE_Tnp_1-associated